MKMTIKRGRTTHLARTACLNIKFTPAQLRRIEKAAKICGWKSGETALYARKLVLRGGDFILRGDADRRLLKTLCRKPAASFIASYQLASSQEIHSFYSKFPDLPVDLAFSTRID
jgi:hypothetical protein